jgi:hypothetical protein
MKKNILSAVLLNLELIIMGFVCQKVFVDNLGLELLGVKGILGSVNAVFLLADCGLTSTVIYYVINGKKLSTVLNLLKVYSRKILIITIIISAVALPFLVVFVKPGLTNVNLYLVFILYYMFCLLTLCITFKQSIFIAKKQAYIINYLYFFSDLLVNLINIYALNIYKNFYLYLVILVIIKLAEFIVISVLFYNNFNVVHTSGDKAAVHNKVQLSILGGASRDKVQYSEIDPALKTDLHERMNASVYHNLGSYFSSFTDMLIISKLIGITTVGIYSNYFLVTRSLESFFALVFKSLIGNFGERVSKGTKNGWDDTELNRTMFTNKIVFCTHAIVCWAAITACFLFQPFISLWLGPEYLFPKRVVFFIVMAFYFSTTKSGVNYIKISLGIVKEDKWVPVIEVLANMLISVVLCLKFGIIGVFIGTAISSLIPHLFDYPIYVYKKSLGSSPLVYIGRFVFFTCYSFMIGLITYGVTSLIWEQYSLLYMVETAFVCLVVPAVFWGGLYKFLNR